MRPTPPSFATDPAPWVGNVRPFLVPSVEIALPERRPGVVRLAVAEVLDHRGQPLGRARVVEALQGDAKWADYAMVLPAIDPEPWGVGVRKDDPKFKVATPAAPATTPAGAPAGLPKLRTSPQPISRTPRASASGTLMILRCGSGATDHCFPSTKR